MIADNSGPGVKRTGRQSAERKRQILASFFESWRLRVGKDLFPLIRMLIPEVGGTAISDAMDDLGI